VRAEALNVATHAAMRQHSPERIEGVRTGNRVGIIDITESMNRTTVDTIIQHWELSLYFSPLHTSRNGKAVALRLLWALNFNKLYNRKEDDVRK
jgi:hypothetical protein